MNSVLPFSGNAVKILRTPHFVHVLAIILCLLLAACSSGTSEVAIQPTQPTQPTPIPSTPLKATPTVQQQSLPKGLLNSRYPVMDWVFNLTCGLAADAYSRSSMNATIAYDSAAWLYPSDGHLVKGSQNCDQPALISQARQQGLPTLLTIGVDGSWPAQDLAKYIDQAASQPQVPCTPQATTWICSIVNWAASGGYAGVIIDFESVTWNYPHVRERFATFMQELQAALHQKGMLCGVTLIPKVTDTPTDPFYKLNNFQDWQALSGTDFLIDMVLDLDLSLNKPGPITSAPWIAQQLNYLWQTIPQALSKMIWELPLYGHEWMEDTNASWHHLSDETCQQVSEQKAAQTLLPNVSQDPMTPEIAWNDQNGHRHEVWYNKASSLVAIMTQAQDKIRGLLNNAHYKLPTSFWYRGAECANFFGTGNALEAFYNG